MSTDPPPLCRCSHPPHPATALVRTALGPRWYCADTAAQLRALLAVRPTPATHATHGGAR